MKDPAQAIRDLERSLEGHKKVLERYAERLSRAQDQKAMILVALARIASELGWRVEKCMQPDESQVPHLYLMIAFPGGPAVFKIQPKAISLFELVPQVEWSSTIAPWAEEEDSWKLLLSPNLTETFGSPS